MSNELKIEAGKYYRRRDGHRVYVCATNKPGSYPIVAWDDLGGVDEHNELGRLYSEADGGESCFDIISEWVEPERIPWEHLPKWCRWWVKQQGGSEWGSCEQPIQETYSWVINRGEGGCVRLPDHLHSNYTGDWRKSLRERPESV